MFTETRRKNEEMLQIFNAVLINVKIMMLKILRKLRIKNQNNNSPRMSEQQPKDQNKQNSDHKIWYSSFSHTGSAVNSPKRQQQQKQQA